eukprot:6184721-Pleurochrysis_carterae.AAC.1
MFSIQQAAFQPHIERRIVGDLQEVGNDLAQLISLRLQETVLDPDLVASLAIFPNGDAEAFVMLNAMLNTDPVRWNAARVCTRACTR